MKLQMRSWVFGFFVVLSLVGVVVCQMYRQGGDDIHWKMVGLPCSIPLVNAYLFSLVQSLFLIVIMSDFPRRLVRSGLRDGVLVRPFGNTLYYWGSLTGVFLSFMAVQYTFNATAVEVTPNAQGRVIIPQSLREFAEIEGDAVVIGMTNRLEIWSKKNYEDYVASQNENLALALKELKL